MNNQKKLATKKEAEELKNNIKKLDSELNVTLHKTMCSPTCFYYVIKLEKKGLLIYTTVIGLLSEYYYAIDVTNKNKVTLLF